MAVQVASGFATMSMSCRHANWRKSSRRTYYSVAQTTFSESTAITTR